MNDDDFRFREFVRTVGRGEKRAKPLNFDDASVAMGMILDGRADPQQASAFLLACRMKGEDPIEVAGFTQALQQRCQIIPISIEQRQSAVCAGHPYDGREDTFIMGAGAAIVAAACGATVVLHGAPKVPAKHAPTIAEVFAALKIPAYLASNAAADFLTRHGFVHADTRAFLPPWTAQLDVREKIGLRLPFSTVEKLLDPVACGNVVVGIAHGPYLAKIAGALQRLKVKGLIVQGLEGSCDLSPQHPARIAEVRLEGAESPALEIAVDPRALSELPAALDVRAIGADPVKSAELIRSALSGSTDETSRAAAEAIALNAGVLLWRADRAVDLKAGFGRAREIIFSGAAAALLNQF